jgi:HAD superfamily hydrolase (TIGR01509 family)
MMGMRTDEWAQYMHDALGVALPPEVIKEQIVERVSARLSEKVPILPGADSALERLSRAFTLGLATSSALPVARAVLDGTGWKKYFKVVVSADSVARGKPAPDVYLRACELLDADAARTAAIEDSANGIRSAYAAELVVVAIPNREFYPDADALAMATRVVDTLDVLDVAMIRGLIESAGAE